MFTNDHGYVQFVLICNPFRSTFMTSWDESKVTLVEQELLTLVEHTSAPLVFSVRVARSLVCHVFIQRINAASLLKMPDLKKKIEF